ncbi:AzlD domain-containing protein [Desulfogranum japonicum]|uniref:AzlD domain-containing protein n=1 Tax=Desulfogranum japonicum TaxID=231447 RepID=UPI00040AE346|nr:AzlD domain-containing protein [Desulfogranum japonicum]
MTFYEYFVLFAGMGLVTYIPRWLPLLFLAHRRLPQWLIDWLSLIPVAILSSLLAPILFTTAEPRIFSPGKPELLVAIPTFLFAVKTKSLGGTVVVGMLLYWLAGLFL